MKSLLRPLLAALALGLAFFPSPARAAGPTPEMRVDRLDALVTLAPDQKPKVADVFRREDAELLALDPSDRPLKTMDVRQASRDRVRALLTPAQQKVYDRAPQVRGGGLTLPTPETKLANLDKNVGLTEVQKAVATLVFQEEFDALVAIPPGERLERGQPYRTAAQDQVRALLTPEQLNKMDNVQQAERAEDKANRTAVENVLRASKTIAARLGPIASLSVVTSMASITSKDASIKGTYTFRVVGGTATDTLVASWERSSPASDLRVVRVTLGGETIQL
jgi:hypothetical protein